MSTSQMQRLVVNILFLSSVSLVLFSMLFGLVVLHIVVLVGLSPVVAGVGVLIEWVSFLVQKVLNSGVNTRLIVAVMSMGRWFMSVQKSVKAWLIVVKGSNHIMFVSTLEGLHFDDHVASAGVDILRVEDA